MVGFDFFCGCTHFIAAFTKTTPLGKAAANIFAIVGSGLCATAELLVKTPLATARALLRIDAVYLSICLPVRDDFLKKKLSNLEPQSH